MAWRLLVRRCPTKSMTVVGDLAQTSSLGGARSWAAVLDPHAAGRWTVAELTVNYRTPGLIMEVASRMLELAGVETTPPTSAREGHWPPSAVRARCGRPRRADRRWSRAERATVTPGQPRGDHQPRAGGCGDRRRGPRRSGATRSPSTAPAEGAVSVVTVEDVKGLEFDGVVLVEPAEILAESPRGASDLYVAMTRPTQRLVVVHTARPAGGDGRPGGVAAGRGRVRARPLRTRPRGAGVGRSAGSRAAARCATTTGWWPASRRRRSCSPPRPTRRGPSRPRPARCPSPGPPDVRLRRRESRPRLARARPRWALDFDRGQPTADPTTTPSALGDERTPAPRRRPAPPTPPSASSNGGGRKPPKTGDRIWCSSSTSSSSARSRTSRSRRAPDRDAVDGRWRPTSQGPRARRATCCWPKASRNQASTSGPSWLGTIT